MKCSDVKRLCCGHIDGELACTEEEELQAHLRECPECAAQLEQLADCVDLLHGLPSVDPGPTFYDCVRRKIAAAEAGDLQLTPEAQPWGDRLRDWWGGLTMRPAMAAGVWLLCGILLGGGVARLAWYAPGEGTTSGPNLVAVPPAGDLSGGYADLEGGSPLSDLNLDHLAAVSDTNRLEPEFLLEPYVQDPQRGLVPAGMDYTRGVAGDREAQNDVYTVF